MTQQIQSIIDLAWEGRAALTTTNSPEVREAVDQRGCVLSDMVAVWGDDHFKVRNFNRWLETHTAPDVTPTMGLL